MFSNRYGLPPVDALKNDVVSVRSITSIMRAVTSIGAPSTMSTEVESTPHTKIGRRVHVIPGARWVRTVAIMLMPVSTIERPMRVNATA